jgi:trehalose 6-phosphate synthase
MPNYRAAAVPPRPLVVVSNRGPLAFDRDESGALAARRGAGGLVSSLGPLVQGSGAAWVAAALSDGDREAAAQGVVEAEGFRTRMLALDADDHRMAYDVISNATLWYLHHGLFDLPRRPVIDRRWWEAWAAYRRVNEAFATATDEASPDGAMVLVQDYHLTLLGGLLQTRRPDVTTVHFSHTPFCGPNSIRVLPEPVAVELLSGMAAHDACGFHTERWARAFEACCRDVLGNACATFVAPLGPDADDVRGVAASAACDEGLAWVDEIASGRKLVVRVDRIELSKNIVRGFLAFDELLRARPEWRERVVFLALVYPSRQGLADYLAYRNEVAGVVARVNARWATASWTPIVLDERDDFPRSVAALRAYDALLVNPVKDGMNLVAKEGPLVNERDGVLCLSRDAGAWDELGGHAVEVHPYDIVATADALHTALTLPADERAQRARSLRDAVLARTPRDWLDDQLRAAELHPSN